VNDIALDSERPHHLRALHGLQNQLLAVFDGSSEGVFIYLDREHKACSERLAAMFGYSPLQWEELYPFERLFSEESRDAVMATYYEKIIAEKAPAQVSFTGMRGDGSSFAARLLMVPITYDGLLFALCFVRQGQE
jgi:PAS domain S-box-containing protein